MVRLWGRSGTVMAVFYQMCCKIMKTMFGNYFPNKLVLIKSGHIFVIKSVLLRRLTWIYIMLFFVFVYYFKLTGLLENIKKKTWIWGCAPLKKKDASGVRFQKVKIGEINLKGLNKWKIAEFRYSVYCKLGYFVPLLAWFNFVYKYLY